VEVEISTHFIMNGSIWVAFLSQMSPKKGHVQIDQLLTEKGGFHHMDTAGRICLMIEAKLSLGPSICSVRRLGKNRRVHDGVSVTSGNFLAAKKEEFTYEVATACALALGAEKLICIIDGPILDE
ncbi:probable amino-acid acetyltransferase NAGS1, chloroplastic isoform X1, partial [Tanacetum coccineum]